jgi:hypothetical protein
MIKGFFVAVLLAGASLGANSINVVAGSAGEPERRWFTVVGDPTQPDSETVQVDPVALDTDDDTRTMGLRVNRSQEHRNWDEVPYRSYESRVLINCRAHRAHYLEATFYSEPLWQGNPHQAANYRKSPKPMLFSGMTPNPVERIIRAACRPMG